jgi:hypothetical protein
MITAGDPFEIDPQNTNRTYMGIPLKDVMEVALSDQVLAAWQPYGQLKHGFGLAIADPAFSNGTLNGSYEGWDDPSKMGWFVYGTGRKGRRYAHDAVRANRAAGRLGGGTLLSLTYDQGRFQDPVDSVEPNGTFLWGDSTDGSSCYVDFGAHRILIGVSGLQPDENAFFANALGGAAGLAMHRAGLGQSVFRS